MFLHEALNAELGVRTENVSSPVDVVSSVHASCRYDLQWLRNICYLKFKLSDYGLMETSNSIYNQRKQLFLLCIIREKLICLAANTETGNKTRKKDGLISKSVICRDIVRCVIKCPTHTSVIGRNQISHTLAAHRPTRTTRIQCVKNYGLKRNQLHTDS